MKENTTSAKPTPVLRLIDAIVLIIGLVVGAGIFRTPSVVAGNVPDAALFYGAWVLGGLISLIGALCYSELSSAFPHAGGDYHFMKLAYGKRFSFLFAWSRVTVTQTGSIALLAYIAGDYMAQLYPFHAYASTLYALAVVLLLTFINVLGINFGTGFQKFLTSFQFIGIMVIVLTGLFFSPSVPLETMGPTADSSLSATSSINLALIFVLLTFGGWNEAAYISSELRTGSKNMAFVLIVSIVLITVIYLLINMSYLRVLGLDGMAASDAVGVDMMRVALGDRGVVLIGVLVTLSALTSLNTTIFTGARSNYALGGDFSSLSFLAKWNGEKSAPVNSLLVQGGIASALILLGAFTRDGFESMVDFTAPVFWFFFLFTGISLFVLRHKKPNVKRPFKVPFYPVTPLIFVIVCGYMLYSSLAVTGIGSFVGVAVLLTGLLFLLFTRVRQKNNR